MQGKKFVKPLIYVGLGLILGLPLFSLMYYTMVRTSTPQFCSTCHEIRPAYWAWKTSTHVNNPQGVVADCMDCHLPPPQDTIDFFYTKTLHGAKDVIAHFMGVEYVREEQRQKAYASIQNDSCQKCHRNIIHLPYKRGAMLAHRTVLYSRDHQYKCTDCHRRLVHVDRELYTYKGQTGPYRGQGL